MIDWIIIGALVAILLAELVDAWALHRLARHCLGLRATTPTQARLVRWYAEGFEHSRAVASWLGAICVALTVLAVLCGAHPLVIAASLLLAVGAHGERHFSARLRRRCLMPAARAG